MQRAAASVWFCLKPNTKAIEYNGLRCRRAILLLCSKAVTKAGKDTPTTPRAAGTNGAKGNCLHHILTDFNFSYQTVSRNFVSLRLNVMKLRLCPTKFWRLPAPLTPLYVFTNFPTRDACNQPQEMHNSTMPFFPDSHMANWFWTKNNHASGTILQPNFSKLDTFEFKLWHKININVTKWIYYL